MRALIFLFIALFLEAKSFEQAFNIVTIEPKVEQRYSSAEFYGTTTYDESKIFDITMRFDGFIEKLYANEKYLSISKNQKLFEVYSKEIYDLQQELNISGNLFGTALKNTLQKKLSLYDFDEKTIAKIVNKPSDALPFYSKYSGVIIEKYINEGSFVKNGMLLFKIADTSTMWIIAKVYQKDLQSIYEGMRATAKVEGILKPIEAKVDKIYPIINSKDLMCDVRLRVDNRANLIYPNMFVKISISNKSKSMITLPKNAVIRRDGKFYVFKELEASKYEPREIEAKYMGEYYEILSGLEIKDKVAQNALFLLDSDALTSGLYTKEEW